MDREAEVGAEPSAFFAALPGLLGRVDSPRRAAFAAACAERLAGAVPGGVPEVARAALDLLWESLTESAGLDTRELARAADQCEAQVADEDALIDLRAVASDDALAAVVFALRARLSGDAQHAIWAARRVWDSIDWYVANCIVPAASEEAILTHRLVRSESRRQARDIDALTVSRDISLPAVVRELRDTAQRDANEVLGCPEERT